MKEKSQVFIRCLAADDIPVILEIISSCRREYGLQGRVESILEPTDYAMLEIYRRPRSSYFVAVIDGDIAGGGGIAPLTGDDHLTCELQRMYLRRVNRGVGVGHALLGTCIQAATQFQFDHCYAETISEMSTAVAFYKRQGFQQLATPLGQSGHSLNDCWMMRDIRGLLSLRYAYTAS